MKNAELLTLIAIAVTGTVLSATSANALSFNYNPGNSSSGTFSYDITLSSGETLSLGDPLTLEGLGGITAVNSASNPNLQFSNDFDSESASFLTTDGGTGEQTFTNAIALTSSNAIGTINYSANSSLGAFGGMTQGPITAVPFEPSANLGIFTLLGIFGFNHYRKKLKCEK